MAVKECKYRMMLKEKDRGCIEHKCHHFVSLRICDAQTGIQKDEFICSELAQLQVDFDSGRLQTEQIASLNSFRNEVVKGNSGFLSLVQTAMQQQKTLKHETEG